MTAEQLSQLEHEHNETVKLPRGWTYLIHGTDMARWGDVLENGDDLVLDPPISVPSPLANGENYGMMVGGLSVVTREYRVRHDPGGELDVVLSFARASTPVNDNADPVQIRVIFWDQGLSSRLDYKDEALSDISATLSKEQQALIDKYYYDNAKRDLHPLVPGGTELEFIGKSKDEYSETPAYYYIPKEVAVDFASYSIK